MTDPRRDRAIERLLPRMGEAAGTNCPDAETLAAWTDGTLRAEERARVETHAAGCARCQMHLAAMARTSPLEATEPARAKRLRFVPWLIPVTGAIAAAGLWFIVQSPRGPVEQQEQTTPAAPRELQVQRPPEALQPQREEEARKEDRLSSPPPAAVAPLARQAEPKHERRVLKDSAATDVRATEAPAAAAGRAAMAPARNAEEFGAITLQVHRSPEGMVTWEPRPSTITDRLIAGASPSPSVIWLAGRDGLVLLTTDGTTWRAVPFPASVDLTRIEAADATSATVTSADGRRFATFDGGTTWTLR